jgi:putative transposase
MLVRKRIRLSEYDYSQTGYYFVTICTHHFKQLFGMVINEKMVLSQTGIIILSNWKKISSLHHYSELDDFVIMPNHIHGIIIIDEPMVEDANFASSTDRSKMALCKVIQQFKRACTIEIDKVNGNKIKIWQRSFYDRVIRNEKELFKIRLYIKQNPLRWDLEKNKLINLEI